MSEGAGATAGSGLGLEAGVPHGAAGQDHPAQRNELAAQDSGPSHGRAGPGV